MAGFYLLGKQGQVAQWGALLVGLAAAFVVFMTSESGKEFVAFGRDSWKEVKKVVWPTRKEAIQMTLVRHRVLRRDGAVPVADRQDPRMGVLRPDFGVEEVMSDITDTAAETPSADAPPAAPAKPVHPDMHWYVVHAYSGMEKAVERNIRERINRAGMQDMFGEILVPTEEVVEIKNGQKKTSERRFYPGYVLVQMIMNDDTWHLVKHTNKVTGFVGGAKNRPAPISEDEVAKILGQMEEGTEKPRHKVEFVTGEYVRVKDGPFTDFNGTVEEVNYEKNKVRVSVTIFGRATPVELEFSQVEKT